MVNFDNNGYDGTSELELTEKQFLGIITAMAGGHNLLAYGAHGEGKTYTCSKLNWLKPNMTDETAGTTDRIYKIVGLQPNGDVAPFRMPHFTSSIEDMCGGGPNIMPGEVSLANGGILFLDEASEFRTSVVQILRIALENRNITLSRAGRSTTYPSDFQLMMTMNPCPCGNYGTNDKICLCSARAVEQYWKKIGDPLLDRIEIRLEFNKTDNAKKKYSLDKLRKIISVAVERQLARGKFNSHLEPCELTEIKFESGAYEKFDKLFGHVSSRRRGNVLKLCKTLADLEMSDYVSIENIKDAEKLNRFDLV